MAQLIKINQCVSRYQHNFRLYANRYHWLKQRRGQEWKQNWENHLSHIKTYGGVDDNEDKKSWFHDFENWLFEKQIEWSTRTAYEQSQLPESIREECWLKRIVHGINDVSFLMFQPVLLTKSGSVQLDSLLISNDTISCIHPVSGAYGAVFRPVSQRQWKIIADGGNIRTIINPLISLRRSQAVVSSFLKKNELSGFNVTSVVYAPECYIEDPGTGSYEAEFVDRRNELSWFQKVDQHSLLMKREQVDCVEQLLIHCETVAEPRD